MGSVFLSLLIDVRWDLDYLSPAMTKDKLIKILRGILKTDNDLSFLLKLKKGELETLVACVRDRVENFRG